MNTGWNDRRPVRQIDINSLKPKASIDAINKIISGKVIGYFIDEARTGSMYLSFEVPETEKDFKIRTSNHSKIDGVYDDTIETYDNEIEINIFSKEKKDEALSFLKDYFSKIKVLPTSSDVFTNKLVKKVLKSKYPEIVETYLKKIKVDTSKTIKQVQAQVLEKLLQMKPIGTLKKREYQKSRGSFRFVGEKEYTGIIHHISSTGRMVSIEGETGQDFEIKNQLHRSLLEFACFTGGVAYLESYLQK